MNVHCCCAYSADAEALRLLHAAEESVEHILISVQIGQLEMSPGWSSLAGSSREGRSEGREMGTGGGGGSGREDETTSIIGVDWRCVVDRFIDWSARKQCDEPIT